MKIGYARVSTSSQNLDRQIEELKRYSCEKIYTDKFTGTKYNRPGFEDMMAYAREGDEIIVTELSRLGRTTKELLILVDELKKKNISIISLKENIDVNTATGKAFYSIMSALSELEHDIIVERVKEGMEIARQHGRSGGRKKEISKHKIALALYDSKQYTIAQVCSEAKISRATFYRALKERNNGKESTSNK